MQQSNTEELDIRIERLVDCELPDRPTANIGVALRVADFMESKGYSFSLKDMRPKSLDESLWKAVFSTAGKEFSAEDSCSEVAVCTAAAEALEAAETA